MADKENFLLTTAEALKYVKNTLGHSITLATMINWSRENKLGYQLAGRGKWYIRKDRLENFLKEGSNNDETHKTTTEKDTGRSSKSDRRVRGNNERRQEGKSRLS